MSTPGGTRVIGSVEWQEEVPDRQHGLTWEQAQTLAEVLGDGWRLPTIEELHTLVSYFRRSPACAVFSDCPPRCFWADSPVLQSPGNVWVVDFGSGAVLPYPMEERACKHWTPAQRRWSGWVTARCSRRGPSASEGTGCSGWRRAQAWTAG